MSNRYSVYKEGGKAKSLTWYVGDESYTVTDDHKNFDSIYRKVRWGAPKEDILPLFSNKTRVNDYFESAGLYGCHFDGNVVWVNGQQVQDELSTLIIDHVNEGTDPTHLVTFFNKLLNNPSYQSQKELVSFIARHGLTITKQGNFIAYKGLRRDGRSVHSGNATVNGKAVNGHIPNQVGNVISMPRGSVDDNRNVGCSQGLHAGTWSYASSFGRGETARVEIDPSDVVSVPKDSSEQKLRVCKYTVVESSLTKPTESLLWSNDANTTSTTANSSTNVLWKSAV